ncbi:MAG: glycosyltransferase family 2 protein [Solirubrobacteraceae bacterium]
MNLAACVIFYHPVQNEVIKNINSYINEVEKIYIIDNTPEPDVALVKTFNSYQKTEYIANNNNLGIAKALNQACEKAILDGFEWIITFDQDSCCLEDTISTLVELAKENQSIGSISPVYIKNKENRLDQIADWQFLKNQIEVQSAITSCSLTNLRAFKKVGGFEDSFFIDLVDTDFSFKLRENNFKVLITNKTAFIHSLGESSYFTLWNNKKIWYTNHSPIRRYYITRNRFYFIKKYKENHLTFCRNELKNILKEAIKIVLFEDQKFAKAKAIFYGFSDFYKGVSGKSSREF